MPCSGLHPWYLLTEQGPESDLPLALAHPLRGQSYSVALPALQVCDEVTFSNLSAHWKLLGEFGKYESLFPIPRIWDLISLGCGLRFGTLEIAQVKF